MHIRIAMIPTRNITPTSSIPTTFDHGEVSKYAVADILSSFASGDPNSTSTGDLFTTNTSGVDLLTPTTLANLEQTFLQLQQGDPSSSAEHRARESGFVPPIINPSSASQMVKQEFPDFSLCDDEDSSSQDSEWMAPAGKRGRYDDDSMMMQAYDNGSMNVSPRTGGRKRRGKDDPNLTPDEHVKRGVRRERNKVAAAKCRQRRVDLTNTLLIESEGLEEEQSKLENEIQMLQQQKDQLHFLLEAHKPACSAAVHPVDSSSVSVKAEKVDISYPSVLASAASTNNISTSTTHLATGAPVVSTTFINPMSRPSTLPIVYNCPDSRVAGIPITTPSSVLNFGLESMMDGHTGLTPITGHPSCSSQMHRNSTDGSTSSDNMSSPTTLIAL